LTPLPPGRTGPVVIKNPPTPAPLQPPPAPPPPAKTENEDLSEEEIDDALNEPNTAVEITEPMQMPNPTPGKFSLPGIEKLPTDMGSGVPNQAIGSRNHGYLQKAAEFPNQGPGFVARDHGSFDFGTNLTVDLLQRVMGEVDKEYPNQTPIVLGNVSRRSGGPSGHVSHQIGLDADVGFPSTSRNRDLWSACTKGQVEVRFRSGSGMKRKYGTACLNANISSQLDTERFWVFLKEVTCAEGSPVIAMFLDLQIKQHMCRHAKKRGEDLGDKKSCAYRTLRALYHEAGHYNHVHVRLRCPGNRDCQNSIVSLADITGCE
jgi:murein endopeptidase